MRAGTSRVRTQHPKGPGKTFTREQMVCSVKVGHVSERMARLAADEGAERSGFPLYVYRCKNCKLWHLTKRKQR